MPLPFATRPTMPPADRDASPVEAEHDRLARLRWRCRRGMRELDMLLMRYLERDYPAADPARRAAFESLLELQDPEILDLLNGRLQAEDEALAHVVQRLLVHD